MQYNTTPRTNFPRETVINVYSSTNDWIDYNFVVSTHRLSAAVEALEQAWDAWWDTDPSLTLFEELELALEKAGIPFFTIEED